MGQDTSTPSKTTLTGAGKTIPAALQALKLNLRCFMDDRFQVFEQVIPSANESILNQRIYFAQCPGDAKRYSVDIQRNRFNNLYGAIVTL